MDPTQGWDYHVATTRNSISAIAGSYDSGHPSHCTSAAKVASAGSAMGVGDMESSAPETGEPGVEAKEHRHHRRKPWFE